MSEHSSSGLKSTERAGILTQVGVNRDNASAPRRAVPSDPSAISRDRLQGRGDIQMVMRLHHLSHRLFTRRRVRLSRFVERLIRFIYSARIPAEAQIDRSVHFSHNALAVVITKMASIGPRCEIGTHVSLGSRWPLAGGPELAEDVIVHAGAKIIGPVRIGRGSVIGANAVVINDVPPRSLAVGVPAVVKKSGIWIEDYFPKGEED